LAATGPVPKKTILSDIVTGVFLAPDESQYQ
jgi:hypothetical protein